MIEPRVFILASPLDPPWLVERTRRRHVQAELVQPGKRQLSKGCCWLINAGSWTPRRQLLTVPMSEQPVALVGAMLDEAGKPETAWRQWLQQTGGIALHPPPSVHSICLNDAAVEMADRMRWTSLEELVSELQARQVRFIRHAPLDVRHDRHLRVLEVVTSLQRGGAERMVLSLHDELPRHGVASTLCVLGSPTRGSFNTPGGVVSLKHLPFNSVARAEGIHDVALLAGSDVIHAHLIEGETVTWLTSKRWPLMVTLHNERVGWQSGFDHTLPTSSHLMLVACSSKVEHDARTAMPGVMMRTAWNGIEAGAFSSSRRLDVRRRWEIPADAAVLLVLANPRPQKRLAKTAEVFAQWNARHPAHLILAGEPSMFHESAATELASFWQVIDQHGLRERVHAVGGVADVAGLLSACDILLSTSAHEGMSLAQLESIAAGLRLVITDAGGAAELAEGHPSVIVVPKDAPESAFVDAITEAFQRSSAPLARDFSSRAMALRYRWLMRLLLRNRGLERKGVLLVTNNFSTGGAQSSARRLLLGLRDAGEHVRAATLGECPDTPTPGRKTLEQAGVEVIATLPPDAAEATGALMALLDATDREPPATVLFWNVMPEYKVLLAEAFDDVPVIDVSPGEMFFDSLQRYFARPRAGSPYRSVRDYAALLSTVVVKHTQEAEKAKEWFHVPVHVIANGVVIPKDQNAVSANPLQGSVQRGLIIGTAARLHPHKRLEDVLEAFRLVCGQRNDVSLRIAGGEEEGFAEYARLLRTRAETLPVTWLGDVSDIAAFHAELDVFVMISEPIGCPNASLEAMAAGLTVVATAVGGAMDQIIDNESGLLTPARDTTALAAALLRVLGDASLRGRLGRAARARAGQSFSLDSMIRGYQKVMHP